MLLSLQHMPGAALVKMTSDLHDLPCTTGVAPQDTVLQAENNTISTNMYTITCVYETSDHTFVRRYHAK